MRHAENIENMQQISKYKQKNLRFGLFLHIFKLLLIHRAQQS